VSNSVFALATALLLAFAPPDAEPPDAAVPEPAPTYERRTFEGDPIGVQQFVLANGLTVLLSENHERPEVFGAVVVRTGSKNDPADNTGMAHYLEHMLFKGTQTLGTTDWAAEAPLQAELVELFERHTQAESEAERAAIQAEIGEVVEQTYAYVIPNELDRMLGQLGSTGVNAYTTVDETVYHNTFPASQIDNWLTIYAHRFVDPVFRLFPTELEAVYEEKNISLDHFEGKVAERFMARAFPEHPYGATTIIGEIEHLKRPSLLAMQAYFDEYYVANNMALVLSGDFDTEAILPIIAERFGPWRSGPEPTPRTGTVEPFVGRELVKLRLTPLRVGAYCFRTPTTRDDDYAALQVMRELLSNEQGSGFIDTLSSEGKLMMAFSAPTDYADHGLHTVLFAPRIFGQTFKRAEALVFEQFRRIARGEFDEAKMLAIRDELRRAEDRQWENNEERALALVDNFIARESWQAYLEYRERLANVTREDVMRVAETYFGDDHLAMRSRIGIHKPTRLSKPNYPPVDPVPGARSSFYEQVMAQPSRSASPSATLRFVDFETDMITTPIAEGVALYTNPNPFNDTYTLELVFGVGSKQIRELTIAAEYLQRLGTREHSPTALREQLSLLGTSFSIWVGYDRTGVTVTGPEQHMAAALALLDDLVREPIADPKRWKTLRRERVATENINREDGTHWASAALWYAMYGEESVFLRDYGRAGLRELDPDTLLAAWQRARSYALDLRYTGQRSPSEVATILSESLTLTEPRTPAVPRVVHERVMPSRDTVYFLPRRKLIQTQLSFVVDGEPVAPEHYAAADAYSEFMGGNMSGVVFQEIREFRALAYSAWGTFARDSNPAQAGYFMGGIGCQADKTYEAIDVMMGLIRELPNKPERIDAVQSALVRRLESSSPGFRELQRTIAYWQRLGYTEDPRRSLLDDYASLDFADIEALHAAQIAGRPVILVVVGDPKLVDKAELARFGEVVELREQDVFPR
jgi:zinc protease